MFSNLTSHLPGGETYTPHNVFVFSNTTINADFYLPSNYIINNQFLVWKKLRGKE
jgi:hypothetical protein